MSWLKRYCCAALILSLILSAVSCAALSEEGQQIDLMELIAPEEAFVTEEAPAAEGETEAVVEGEGGNSLHSGEAGTPPSEGETSGEPAPEVAAPVGEAQPAPEAAAPAGEAQPAPEAAPAGEAQPAPEAAPAGEAQPAAEAAPAGEAQPASEAAAPAGEAQPAAEAAPAGEAQPAQTQPVTLNATELTLGKGETFALMPIVPNGAEALYFEYATSNRKVATVSEFGEITAKKKGSATITVKVSDGTTLTCAVNVLKAPKSIKLNASDVALGLDALTRSNTTFQLTCTLSKGAGALIHYASANSAVAEVSPTGLITPRSHGITTVTASTFNGKSASCSVAVLAGPDEMSFEETAPVLCEREKRVLKLAVTQGTLAAAQFVSSNPAVATVDANTGEVTAVAYGEAMIIATSFNGKTAGSAITVNPGPDAISLPAKEITMGVGEELMLGAMPLRSDGKATSPGLTYATSKAKCVTVSDDGVLTARKRGTAKITVSAPNGVQAVCTVKVIKAPKSIKLTAEKTVLQYAPERGVAEQTRLKATASGGTLGSVIYSDYDTNVVSVSVDGVVTAQGIGTTSITARSYNGKTASCRITVCAVAEGDPEQSGTGKVRIVAHRGGAGYWPENTLEAFRNTASTGATAVELDVRSTKDGVQVIHHYDTFTVGDKNYSIKKLKLAELNRLAPDICTLDEALAVIAASGLELNLELKNSSNVKKCVQAVKAHKMQGRTVYISFIPKLLLKVRKLDSSAKLGLINEKPNSFDDLIANVKPAYVFQFKDYLTQADLQRWHQAGLKVGVWTVNDATEIRNWLDMGVDYITSDYPRLVKEALAAR